MSDDIVDFESNNGNVVVVVDVVVGCGVGEGVFDWF